MDVRGLTLIIVSAAVAAVTFLLVKPVPQDEKYHSFADNRTILGVPNFLNVISNLGFVASGLIGVMATIRGWGSGEATLLLCYMTFFAGVFLTGFGSAWYHLKPENETLVWDRLPMTVAFSGLFCSVLGELVSTWTGGALLLPMLALGIFSVIYWAWGEKRGKGDLRLYGMVQFLPILLILLMILMYDAPSRYRSNLLFLMAFYIGAKGTEFLDSTIYSWGGVVSGHTLKHILASAGIIGIVRILSLSIFIAIASAAPSMAETGDSEHPAAKSLSDYSCREHIRKVHGNDPQRINDSMKEEFAAYLPLVEQALAYRDETIALAARLKEKGARGEPLSGEDLDRMKRGTIAHIQLRKGLYVFAEAHECWLDGDDKAFRELGIGREAKMEGVMISLSAALVLYDNYLLAVSVFEEDGKLRRFLNSRDSGYDIESAELARVTSSYSSAYNRERVRSAIRFYEKEMKEMPAGFLESEEAGYLNLLIQQSPSYSMTKRFSPLYVIGKKLRFLSAMTADALKNIAGEGMNIFSMVFGNTVGLVEARKGKLYKKPDAIAEANRTLRAGDILLEKTPFRLTDKLIPGHWGHAAVWVGTEEELKALGIWTDPVVVRHHEAIRQGRGIVEALRSGVEINSVEHFMNVDDMAVLRHRTMSDKERAEAITLALRQVGKEYDFNFDVETTDRIVCSELVYTAYTGIKWPTERTLGRATISPDNVAAKALDGGPLELVLLYHDGKPVMKEASSEMKRLMNRG